MQLNVIREPIDTYSKLVSFIHNPNYIRIGTNESIRTLNFSETFNEIMNELTSHKGDFPQLMKRLISDYPALLISKVHKNSGTFYLGIGLAVNPLPKIKKIPLTKKELNERYADRNRNLINSARDEICANINIFQLS